MKRSGAYSITAALLTIGFIATAALVVWFLVGATRGVVNQPVIYVIGTPTLVDSSSTHMLYFTLMNIGGSAANLTNIEVIIPGDPATYTANCQPAVIPQGGKAHCSVSLSRLPGGNSAVVRTPSGEVQILFSVIKE